MGLKSTGDQYAITPPDELTQDMSRNDLVYVLENLKFNKRSATKQISLDQEVRDFLVRALSPMK
jgi:hypothetical protein